MTRAEWVAARAREFAALRGRRVESWVGVEMAVREDVAGAGPRFVDPDVPFLQLFGLQAVVDDDSAVSVSTYQDDGEFGLWARPESVFPEEEGRWHGIYRWRPLTELPVGRVEEVAVFADHGVVAEVRLRIGARGLLLVAGEVQETMSGGLVFQLLDESVLVFTDPDAADRVPWALSRLGLTPVPDDAAGGG